MSNDQINRFRFFLKDNIRKMIDFSKTDQSRGVPPPPIQKPFNADAEIIALPKIHELKTLPSIDLVAAIERRKSHRNFLPVPLTSAELAFLLWATQGIRHIPHSGTAYRVVPSAGCRHAFETYLCIMNVEGFPEGIYRYLPLEHALLQIKADDTVHLKIVEATFGQSFTGKAAATFIWTALPYRMEWRYGLAAHKVIAIDAGHVCQNLYLACEAISSGCCAIAAYDQDLMDMLIGVDGEDEFTIYMAPVGKL